jgi:precorrin-2/cobalt-factor-2 C20-methyltransferase
MRHDRRGRLYGVGVGPGDPELLTLKAARVIEAADVVFSPKARVKSESLARSIVEQALDREVSFRDLVYPMTRNRSVLEEHWSRAACEVLEVLDAGQTAAFITLGDPTLYSTWTYLQRTLHRTRPDVPVEIIPGVSSINLASALAQIPLVIGEERLAVLPLPDELNELEELTVGFDTVVLMKVGKRFPDLAAFLDEHDLSHTSYLVSRAGLGEEQVVKRVDEIQPGQNGYLSLVIIRTAGMEE